MSVSSDSEDDHIDKRARLDGAVALRDAAQESDEEIRPLRYRLEAHRAEVLDVDFSPSGASLASCSLDKTVQLWAVEGEEPSNYGQIQVTKGTPTCVRYVSESHILVPTSEGVILLYSVVSGQLEKRYVGPRDIINGIDVRAPVVGGGPAEAGDFVFAVGCDDGFLYIYNNVDKTPVAKADLGYPVTDVQWSGEAVFATGLDNDIHLYAPSTEDIKYSLCWHNETVTGLALQKTTRRLASVGADSAVNVWNVSAFAPAPRVHGQPARLVRSLYGAPAGVENFLRRPAWTRHGLHPGVVACGGADRALTVWDTDTGELVCKLGGVEGTVVCAAWSPRGPFVVYGGVDGALCIDGVSL